MIRTTCLIASILATTIGCGGGVPEAARPRSEAVVEPSWEEQIAAVRAGAADEIRIEDAEVTPAQFYGLSRDCRELKTLVINDAQLSDADLDALDSLPHLRWLKLPGPVGDEGASMIARRRELEILNLPDARLTDAGLRRLATLDRLTLLRFGSPNVTDAGLASLRGLDRLRFLHLMSVPVTDAGLDDVAAISSLESFYLDGGHATDAGLSRLLTRRSDLHFHKDQRHLPGDPNAHPH